MLDVEISTQVDLKPVLLEAEVKIHTVYSFIFRPQDRSALAFSVKDREIAVDSLRIRGFNVLQQNEISRQSDYSLMDGCSNRVAPEAFFDTKVWLFEH